MIGKVFKAYDVRAMPNRPRNRRHRADVMSLQVVLDVLAVDFRLGRESGAVPEECKHGPARQLV